jgi:signal transduction histidine kinase
VLNKKDGLFSEQDLELFVSASHYVAIALENAKLYEDLKALDRVKKKVIHHLSHELKTPLVILKGAFRLIRKRLSDSELAKIEKSLARGTRNIKRLSELQLKIDDILTHMKVSPENKIDFRRESLLDLIEEFQDGDEAGSLEDLKAHIQHIDRRSQIHKEFFDVSSLLNPICDKVRTVVEKRSLCLMRQFDNGIRVHTDESVFRKVCSGLLKNAIENTPDEGCVEVAAKSNPESILIEFRDHGVGITEHNQKQIFSGFFQRSPRMPTCRKNCMRSMPVGRALTC